MDSALKEQKPFIDCYAIDEVARLTKFSVDTIKRHIKEGKMADVEWVDFFSTGHLRATKESVHRWIEERRRHARLAFNLPRRRRVG